MPRLPDEAPARFKTELSDGVDIPLSRHVKLLKKLVRRAINAGDEHSLYNPWDYSLNFSTNRTEIKDCRLAVHPQAKLLWNSALDDSGRLEPTRASIAAKNKYRTDQKLTNARPNKSKETSVTPSEERPEAQKKPEKRSTRGKKPEVQSKSEKPYSTASTTLSEAEEAERFPDFVIVMEKMTDSEDNSDDDDARPQGIHSIWEVKVGRDEIRALQQQTGRSQQSRTTIKRIQETLRAQFGIACPQIMQQASAAFVKYPYLSELHIFFVVDLWVKHTFIVRDSIPDFHDCDGDNEESVNFEYFFEDFRHPFFPLLNDDGTDYSQEFLDHWRQACDDAWTCYNKAVSNKE